MKLLKPIVAGVLIAGFLAAPLTVMGVDAKTNNATATKAVKAKPYPLKTCVVSGDKLGEMGDPYVFTYKGQEIKLCCKDCRKKFDQTPAKFMKQIAAAEKKADKAPAK